MATFLQELLVGSYQYGRMFVFSYLVYSQIWLSFLVNDWHFGHIAKLKKKRNIQKHLFWSKYGVVFGKMWFSSVNWTNFANIRKICH